MKKLESFLTAAPVVIACVMLLGAAYPLNAVQSQEKLLTDREITAAVSSALKKDPGVDTNWINVSTEQGILQLTGKTNDILSKTRATKVAELVKGVRAVVNEVEVIPSSRTDEEIEQDVENALLYDPAADSYEVSVEANNGVVVLNGTVESRQEQKLAGKVAMGVKGVVKVRNNINIVYETERPDGEIEAEVEEVLLWDALVDDGLIQVQVEEGEVTLKGAVGSAAEKSRAVADAWVMGVESVDAGELRVETWARDDRFRNQKYRDKSDQEVRKAIRAALFYDPRVPSKNITVAVNNGVAVLGGVVDNLRAKMAAVAAARNTVGVWTVTDDIVVRPNTPSDAEIENAIEKSLKRAPDVSRFDVRVSVIDGKVYLHGNVDSYYEKGRAEEIASTAYGVIEVHNYLDVGAMYDSWIYDPYVDYIYPMDFDWYVRKEFTPKKSDWEIKKTIEKELFWTPFVDEEEITVKVDNGAAKLTGTVETWGERNSAQRKAYDGGAVFVDNNIKVKYGPEYYQTEEE